jgi:hypothetical protein
VPYHAFENPVMALSITNEDSDFGTRVPLWTNAKDFSGYNQALVDANIPSLAVVTDVTVVIDLSGLPVISANLSFPYQEGIAFIESGLIEWGKTILEVQFGYVRDKGKADVSPVYSGTIFDPDVQFSAERMDIAIIAKGLNDAATRGGAVFREGRRCDLIRELATVEYSGSSKASLRNIEVSFAVANKNPATKAALEKVVQISPGWSADWLMIQQLLKDARCWSFFDGRVLQVIPIAGLVKNKPRYIMQYFHPPGVPFGPGHGEGATQGGTWPILTFNSPTMGKYFANMHRGLYAKGLDSGSGMPFSEVIKGTDPSKPNKLTNVGTGNNPPVTKKAPEGNKKDGSQLEPRHNDAKPDELAAEKAAADQQAGLSDLGVTIEIETLGCPNIKPAIDQVKIVGFGKLYDYNYAVFKVTHIVSEGGYVTQLELKSNTQATLDAVNKVKGDIARQEPDTEAADGEEKEPEERC